MKSLFSQFAVLCLLMGGFLSPAAAQDGPPPDSARARPADTLEASPSAPTEQPAASSRQDGLEAPVTFKARDSLVVRLGGEQEEGTLYGEAEAAYNEATLTAHQIDMQLASDELEASGMPSDTGLVGRPHFTRGEDESFYGNQMSYNLRTERGRVATARTSIEEGFVQGDVVKVMEDSTLYVANAAYTTCECEEDPSYSLRSDRMKVKGKWVYSGPLQLFLFNIPTPLWLPFGFLPATQGRRSGPLSFDYGEDGRGFYVRNVGWYQIINDYMDVQLTGGYWTSGSWQLKSRFQYNKRYAYRGDLALDYRRVQTGEETDQNYNERGTIQLNWNHDQEFNPHTSLRSNVTLASESHLRTSEDLNDQTSQEISSRVNFQKRWPNMGRSFSMSARQQQYFATGRVNLTLPRLSFRQNKRKPFKRENRPPGEDEQWYEKITYQYSSSLNNRFDYPSREQRLRNGVDSTSLDIPWYEALVSPDTYREATGEIIPFDFNADHRIPVTASFDVTSLFGQPFFLSLTPNFNYEEVWRLFRRRLQHEEPPGQDASGNPIASSGALPGTEELAFRRETDFTAIRQFDTGVRANTRFFGTFPWSIGPYEGLRHTVRPSLNFSYQPDFSDPFWGYTDSFRDSTYTIVENRFLSGPQKTIRLNVNNSFETKYVSTDSTGETHSESMPLLNVDASMSYNAARERRPLSNLRLRARPQFLDRADVTLLAIFSPYTLDNNQQETGRYVWRDRRPPRLDRFSLTVSTDLGPGEARRSSFGSSLSSGRYGNTSRSGFGSPGNADPVDFSIPWSLSLDFNFDLTSHTLEPTATVNSTFTFNPTPKWQVRGDTGYDFESMEFSTTQLRLYRDLGCWEMSINWVPFGRFQQYGFTLQVKSGKLRDLLKLSHPRSDMKGRFQGLVN